MFARLLRLCPGYRALVCAFVLISAILLLAYSSLKASPGENPPAPIFVGGHQWGLTEATFPAGADPQRANSLLAGLGVSHLRPIVIWSNVQPLGPEEWNWNELDAKFTAYRALGVRTWVLLNSGNADWATDTSWVVPNAAATTSYPPRALPGLEEPITGAEPYFVFVRELVRRYGDVVDAWLIDNEPSEPWSWGGDAYAYVCMARMAAAAVHDADPTAPALLGAIPASTLTLMVIADRLNDPSQEAFIVSYASRMWGKAVTLNQVRAVFTDPNLRAWERVEFYRQALAALPEADGVAGNVSGSQARGDAAADLAWSYADQMMAYGGAVKPVIYTEIDPYLSDQTALAQQTTQFMIGSLASGVVAGQAYLKLVDDTLGLPTSRTGLISATLLPKVGYSAYRTLISCLEPAAYAGSLRLSSPYTGYWFQTEQGSMIYSVWASKKTSINLSLILPTRKVIVYDMIGRKATYYTTSVPVSPSPVYIYPYIATTVSSK